MKMLRAYSEKLSLTPNQLYEEFPLSAVSNQLILNTRKEIIEILKGNNKKLLVIVGPCSIHDSESAKEYAYLLKEAADHYSKHLLVVMRAYFEKPRTSIGWKGFIKDPFLNGDYQIEIGLRKARQLLSEINAIGLPTATEFLDSIIPIYLSDLISWSAIGARTSASPLHREIASALTIPIGFKNTVDGNVSIAIDGIKVARHSHALYSIDENGHPVILKTQGNDFCHVVLRGSHARPNYEASDILEVAELIRNANVTKRLVVDCSHGNSRKDFQRQKEVVASIIEQIRSGCEHICGIMLESHLIGGKQSYPDSKNLIYGQSITDACISWEETLPLLESLATAKKNFVPTATV